MTKTKNIKVEWCENFIKASFKKLPEFATGIETNCFFKMAEKSGLYIAGTYGSPMSKALENLTKVEIIQDNDGNYMFSAFHMKEVQNKKTLKEFKEKNPGGYYCKAAEDIPGFYKKGDLMYGDCDDMVVDSWLYNPLNGIYSVGLKNS